MATIRGNDLANFARRMALLGRKTQENIDKLVRKVVLTAHQSVVLATPVDTGRARGNWQVAVGAAPTTTTPLLSPTGTEAIVSGARALAAYKDGDDVHIVNNLPYIGRLNAGSSAQAPAGFVEAAIAAGVTAAANAKIT